MTERTGPDSPRQQHWCADQYERHARFVADLAVDLIDLLNPRSGQRVLDIGCGDGAFSSRVCARGAQVVGIDPAPDMVRSARARGIEARVGAAQDLREQAAFDLAISNAVFHWIREPRPALAGVFAALRPGGRFVGELGGTGNVASVIRVLVPLLAARGIDFATRNPWRFPEAEHWRSDLESTGFRVTFLKLFERPTPLPTSLGDWLDTFATGLLAGLDPAARSEIKAAAEAAAAPLLKRTDGTWVLDYVRIRFVAIKPETGTG